MTDQFFSIVTSILIPMFVAIVIGLAARAGIVWFKVNQPATAAIIGGFLGGMYRIPELYAILNSKPPEGTPAEFIMMGISAGLAGSGIAALVKDVRSGAISATSEQDIIDMREDKGGIGS